MSAAESCTVVSWCDQPAGHGDRHVRLVGLVEPSGFNTVSAVLVTVEAGPAESEPLPVVALGGKLAPSASVRLTWAEAATLAQLLADAQRRYG
jgi:hypothetical protein